ncbi:MAG: alpha/beta hydrolase fold domain-containing protein [Lachnospiraceae bacterium]|nr:alpha/beta hydrolase fold domain-containing protein [Lachnospiraceae bacterium]
MNIITQNILKRALKDLYALNDLDQEEFAEGLSAFKKKIKKDSAPSRRILRSMNVTRGKCKGGVYYRAVSKKYRSNKVVIYIHGGGFFMEAMNAHWDFCRRLAERTGCEIIFPEYPLVPEHDCVATHEMLMDLYRKVFARYDAKDITIMGDSAGGTLSLSVSMLARDAGLPVANEIVLISPGFVIECDSEKERQRFEEIKKHDFIIGEFPIEKIQALWIGDHEEQKTRGDVTKWDVTGLPRITMFSGTYDIMNIPARKYYRKLKACHHPCHYCERKKGLHVYPLFPNYRAEFELIASRVLG